MREQSFLHPGDEHHRVLQSLGSMQRHQRDAPAAARDLVGVADQRDAFEEIGEAAACLLGVEGARPPASISATF